ncbi:hydroxyacylglutathione hydrolase [Aliiglaciecola sp. LCG003]|uniref:hydroxyacylglutathione hydrolase n=1 Tax=Aliiglaciecola sp. LCG003 TaxID=3053655 RepID=UPI00257317C9|nr:hydroxyacylglutathione hydrolase [Aliiglaciecola sp. LCG003]WJG10649.1 hydroxyacylglutathione hydrolase [Aliiglaciecola sp. LCG003]
MNDKQVSPIPAFTDNYIWCLHDTHNCWVVDPGDAEPVIAFCNANGLILKGILITHHHWDHTGGIEQLTQVYPDIGVLGPDYGNISGLTQRVKQGDEVELAGLDMTFQVIEVPGHTLDHVAYYGNGLVFCGDTMFSAGCGRLFEGTPQQMLHSLKKIMQLPEQTVVYCTHEYTMANLKFALQVEPNNQQLVEYAQWAKKCRSQGKPTLPTTIKQQIAINPFLRAQQDEIKHNAEHYVGRSLPNEDEVFAAVRHWKDNF